MYSWSITNILVDITRIIISTHQISSIGRLRGIPLYSIPSITRRAVAYLGSRSVVAISSIDWSRVASISGRSRVASISGWSRVTSISGWSRVASISGWSRVASISGWSRVASITVAAIG